MTIGVVSAIFLKCSNCRSTKVSSDNLIIQCLDIFDHIYISTGGLLEEEILSVISKYKIHSNKITLLHCVSSYPCSPTDSNIERMTLLNTLFPSKAGYSDHTKGTWIPYMAISKGASVIEKHFTIDNDLPGRDNKNACLPSDLKCICNFRDIHEYALANVKLGRQDVESNIEEFRGRWS